MDFNILNKYLQRLFFFVRVLYDLTLNNKLNYTLSETFNKILLRVFVIITRVRSNLSQYTFKTLVLNMRQNTQPLYEYLVYLCMLLII